MSRVLAPARIQYGVAASNGAFSMTAVHTGEPAVMTMHRAKGMEFAKVILFSVGDSQMPMQWALKDLGEAERADALLQERSLLYVAATRARDELVVSWSGKPSELLGVPGAQVG